MHEPKICEEDVFMEKEQRHRIDSTALRKRVGEFLNDRFDLSEKISSEQIKALVRDLYSDQTRLAKDRQALEDRVTTLQASNRHIMEFIRNLPLAYLAITGNGEIVEVNEGAAAILAVDKTELRGQLLSRFIADEDNSRFRTFIAGLTNTGEGHRCDIRIFSVGEPIQVVLESIPACDSTHDGQVYHIVIYAISSIGIEDGDRGWLLFAQAKIADEALVRKNIALREVMRSIDDERNEIVDRMMTNLQKLVFPLLDRLALKSNPAQLGDVRRLKSNLEKIASGFVTKLAREYRSLTPREIEVCSMIKQGMTSKEIAEAMSVSVETIRNHRKNIRKKLGISKKNINLSTQLRNF